jgi:hypothetical protein
LNRTKHKFSKAKIENCIVDLPETGGRGVIIQSNKILTVAHAVQWSLEGATMALDSENNLQMLGKGGKIFAGAVEVVEPVSDIALISGDELVETPDICKLWQSMVETAPFLKLRTAPLPVDTQIPVWTSTHEGLWLRGNGILYTAKHTHLWAQFEGEIKPGTSGSPIVVIRHAM